MDFLGGYVCSPGLTPLNLNPKPLSKSDEHPDKASCKHVEKLYKRGFSINVFSHPHQTLNPYTPKPYAVIKPRNHETLSSSILGLPFRTLGLWVNPKPQTLNPLNHKP